MNRSTVAAVVVALITNNVFADPPPKGRVTFEEAKATALKSAPHSKIVSSGIEKRGDQWIYSFEIKGSRKNREIVIDAISGKLIHLKDQSPSN